MLRMLVESRLVGHKLVVVGEGHMVLAAGSMSWVADCTVPGRGELAKIPR